MIPKHEIIRLKLNQFFKEFSDYTEFLVIQYDNETPKYRYQAILLNFLERIHLNIKSISRFSTLLIDNLKFKLPIYSLLRLLLSDNIILIYLIEELSFTNENTPDEKKFLKRFQKFTNTSLKRSDSLLNDLIKAKKIKPDDRIQILNLFQNNYPEYSPKLKDDSINPKGLVKKVKEKHYKDELNKIYNLYFIFSQFEHFSKITENAMTAVKDEDKIRDLNYIVASLHHIVLTIYYILSLLFSDSKFISPLEGFKEKLVEMNNN